MTRLIRPLLVFDGDCGFCRAWLARWRLAFGDRVDLAPSQAVAARFPEVPAARFRESVVLFEPDGRTSFGAEAVLRALAEAPGHGGALAAYRRLPGFAAVAEASYRLVAARRDAMMRLTRLLWGRRVVPPGERFTAWLFVRALAVVYAVAFVSLGVQILGLVGHDGILPIASVLGSIGPRMGPEKYVVLPTLCWWNASDTALIAQCVAGCVAAALLFVGVAPVALLAAAWGLYLSVSTAGQEFLWFQWDSLLLETGFLALFVAPWTWWHSPRRGASPHPFAVFLLRWLAFRLMFSSAVVKLSSGDPTWHSLTALQFHFETQPLPTWTAWFAHHLPAAWLRLATIGMFAIEGAVPFLIFLPRRPRMLGVWLMTTLMVAISATGNYGFFNILAVTIFVMLADDGVWPAFARRWARVPDADDGRALGTAEATVPALSDTTDAAAARRGAWPRGLVTWALAGVLLLTLVPPAGTFRRPLPASGALAAVYGALEPLHVVGSYGLFAVMTTTRPEIVVQGSDDGVTWRNYAFRWKPGDVFRPPAFVAPHMPRLDWQMWFAALEPQRIEPWFALFGQRLLEGSPPVLALLRENPFPGAPPRELRAVLYDYRFSTPAARRLTGAWWQRDSLGIYLPPVRLEGGRLVLAQPSPSVP